MLVTASAQPAGEPALDAPPRSLQRQQHLSRALRPRPLEFYSTHPRAGAYWSCCFVQRCKLATSHLHLIWSNGTSTSASRLKQPSMLSACSWVSHAVFLSGRAKPSVPSSTFTVPDPGRICQQKKTNRKTVAYCFQPARSWCNVATR